MTLNKGQKYYKIRPIRMSNKTWEKLRSIKPRGIYWNGFIKELINSYKNKS